ncbi:hypothetical protein ACFLR7_01055 [Acidobacteriota bacterium]
MILPFLLRESTSWGRGNSWFEAWHWREKDDVLGSRDKPQGACQVFHILYEIFSV